MTLSSFRCLYVSFLLRAHFKTFSHLCQCHKNQSLTNLKWSQAYSPSCSFFFRCSHHFSIHTIRIDNKIPWTLLSHLAPFGYVPFVHSRWWSLPRALLPSSTNKHRHPPGPASRGRLLHKNMEIACYNRWSPEVRFWKTQAFFMVLLMMRCLELLQTCDILRL